MKERPEPHLPLIDLIEARRARDEGSERVQAHAEASWKLRYRLAASLFVGGLAPGASFIGEDIRVFALTHGVGQPHHPNAWSAMAGAVIRELLRTERVRRDGWRSAAALRSHACQCPVYRVLP